MEEDSSPWHYTQSGRNFMKTLSSTSWFRKRNFNRHSLLNRVEELCHHIIFRADLWKRNFMKTFPSTAELRNIPEDIPFLGELRKPNFAWAELRNFMKTLPSTAWLLKQTSQDIPLLSGVAEAELWHDITFTAELWKRNFMKTFPSIAESRNFVKTLPSDWSWGSGTLPWHYPQNGVGEG